MTLIFESPMFSGAELKKLPLNPYSTRLDLSLLVILDVPSRPVTLYSKCASCAWKRISAPFSGFGFGEVSDAIRGRQMGAPTSIGKARMISYSASTWFLGVL